MTRRLIAAALFAACSSFIFQGPARAAGVLAGIDVLAERGFEDLKGKKIGLITNQTGKDRSGRSSAQVLAQAPGVELKALFAPEHGFAGAIEDASVSSGTLKLADGREIPIFSLYGSTLAPTGAMLSGLDALVFDIQDVGARFYTYSTTMGMALEAAAAGNIEFFVLDRPNPVTGDIVEGPVLDPGIRSFTSYFPIPVRHGLTMAEIARVHNLMGKIGARLRIIPLKGWSRDQWYDQTGLAWTKPSPNMPDLDSAVLYSGIANFESTNLSVGRGTPIPFRWVGAPWLSPRKILKILKKANLPGMEFEKEKLRPAKSLYAGKRCPGIRIRVTDRGKARPFDLFIVLACALRDAHPKKFEVRWDEMRRMVGTDKFRELYESRAGPGEMLKLFHRSAEEFKAARGPFLLY